MSLMLTTATTAKVGTTVTATVNGVPTVVQVARDLAVAAGDVLLVGKVGAQWFAVARVYPAAPAAVDPGTDPPPPKPAVVTGTLVVTPVETRSYRPSFGWRDDNTDVYQGQYGGWGNHTGAAFYGRKARTLAGATVTAATLKVRRASGGTYAAQPSTLYLLAQSTRPAGAPTLGASTAGPTLAVGDGTIWGLPTSWGQALVDGTAGGIGVFRPTGSPYARFDGRGSWSPAFTLTLNWRRG